MNKPVALAAMTLGALAAAPAPAGVAGEPSDTEGDHVILQVTASPPVTSTKTRPQPVALVFDSREYTDNGQRTTHPTRTNAFRFRGFRFHPEAFAKCLESKLEKVGPSACPKGSRIGQGYAIADARPTLPNPVTAKAQAFNGTLDVDGTGKPITPVAAVLVFAQTDTGIKAYVPAPFQGRDGVITAERTSEQRSLYTLTTVHLNLPAKTRKVKGKTVGFIEAPRTCPRAGWQFTETDSLLSSIEIPAHDLRVTHDSQPCVKAPAG